VRLLHLAVQSMQEEKQVEKGYLGVDLHRNQFTV